MDSEEDGGGFNPLNGSIVPTVSTAFTVSTAPTASTVSTAPTASNEIEGSSGDVEMS